MEKFTQLEYGVIMQAIENAKEAIAGDEFIDPYAENEEGYTNDDCMKALETAGHKIWYQFVTLEK